MLIGHIIGWLFAGLIVGAVARLIIPGRQNIGIPLTIALGVVGAIVGGFISTLIFGPNMMVVDSTGPYAVQTAWPGWIMAIIGGVLVLGVTLAMFGDSLSNRAS